MCFLDMDQPHFNGSRRISNLKKNIQNLKTYKQENPLCLCFLISKMGLMIEPTA